MLMFNKSECTDCSIRLYHLDVSIVGDHYICMHVANYAYGNKKFSRDNQVQNNFIKLQCH